MQSFKYKFIDDLINQDGLSQLYKNNQLIDILVRYKNTPGKVDRNIYIEKIFQNPIHYKNNTMAQLKQQFDKTRVDSSDTNGIQAVQMILASYLQCADIEKETNSVHQKNLDIKKYYETLMEQWYLPKYNICIQKYRELKSKEYFSQTDIFLDETKSLFKDIPIVIVLEVFSPLFSRTCMNIDLFKDKSDLTFILQALKYYNDLSVLKLITTNQSQQQLGDGFGKNEYLYFFCLVIEILDALHQNFILYFSDKTKQQQKIQLQKYFETQYYYLLHVFNGFTTICIRGITKMYQQSFAKYNFKGSYLQNLDSYDLSSFLLFDTGDIHKLLVQQLLFKDTKQNVQLSYKFNQSNTILEDDDEPKSDLDFIKQFPAVDYKYFVQYNLQKDDSKTRKDIKFNLILSNNNSDISKSEQSNLIQILKCTLNLDSLKIQATTGGDDKPDTGGGRVGLTITHNDFADSIAKNLFQIEKAKADQLLQFYQFQKFANKNQIQPINIYNIDVEEQDLQLKLEQNLLQTQFNLVHDIQKKNVKNTQDTIYDYLEQLKMKDEVANLRDQFQDASKYEKKDFYINLRNGNFNEIIKQIDEFISRFTSQKALAQGEIEFESGIVKQLEQLQQVQEFNYRIPPIFTIQKSFFKDYIVDLMSQTEANKTLKHLQTIFDPQNLSRLTYLLVYYRQQVFDNHNTKIKQTFLTFIVRYLDLIFDNISKLLSDFQYDNTKIVQETNPLQGQQDFLIEIVEALTQFLPYYLRIVILIASNDLSIYRDVYQDQLDIDYINQLIQQETYIFETVQYILSILNTTTTLQYCYLNQTTLDQNQQQGELTNQQNFIPQRKLDIVQIFTTLFAQGEFIDKTAWEDKDPAPQYQTFQQIFDNNYNNQKTISFFQSYNYKADINQGQFQKVAVQFAHSSQKSIQTFIANIQSQLHKILKKYVNLNEQTQINQYRPQIHTQLQKIIDTEESILKASVMEVEYSENKVMVDYYLSAQEKKQFTQIIVDENTIPLESFQQDDEDDLVLLELISDNKKIDDQIKNQDYLQILKQQQGEIERYKEILQFSSEELIKDFQQQNQQFHQFYQSIIDQKHDYLSKFQTSYEFISQYKQSNQKLHQMLIKKINHGVDDYIQEQYKSSDRVMLQLHQQIKDETDLFKIFYLEHLRDSISVQRIIQQVYENLSSLLKFRTSSAIDIMNFSQYIAALSDQSKKLQEILKKISIRSSNLHGQSKTQTVMQSQSQTDQMTIAIQSVDQLTLISKLLEIFLQQDSVYVELIKNLNGDIQKINLESDLKDTEYYKELQKLQKQYEQEVIELKKKVQDQELNVKQATQSLETLRNANREQKSDSIQKLKEEARKLKDANHKLQSVLNDQQTLLNKQKDVIGDKDKYASTLLEQKNKIAADYETLKVNLNSLKTELETSQKTQEKNQLTIDRQIQVISYNDSILDLNAILLSCVSSISNTLFGMLDKMYESQQQNKKTTNSHLEQYLIQTISESFKNDLTMISYQTRYNKSLESILSYNKNIFTQREQNSSLSNLFQDNFLKVITQGLDNSFETLTTPGAIDSLQQFVSGHSVIKKWVQQIYQFHTNLKYCYELTQHTILFFRYEVDQFIFNINQANSNSWKSLQVYLKRITADKIGESIQQIFEQNAKFEDIKMQLSKMTVDFNQLQKDMSGESYVKNFANENLKFFNLISADIRKHIKQFYGAQSTIILQNPTFEIQESVWSILPLEQRMKNIQQQFQNFGQTIRDLINSYNEAYVTKAEQLNQQSAQSQQELDQLKQNHIRTVSGLETKIALLNQLESNIKQQTDHNLKELDNIQNIFRSAYDKFELQDLSIFITNVKLLLKEYVEQKNTIDKILVESHKSLEKQSSNSNLNKQTNVSIRNFKHLFQIQQFSKQPDTTLSLQSYINKVQDDKIQLQNLMQDNSDLVTQLSQLKIKISSSGLLSQQNQNLIFQLAELQAEVDSLNSERSLLVEMHEKTIQDLQKQNELRTQQLQKQTVQSQEENQKIIQELEKGYLTNLDQLKKKRELQINIQDQTLKQYLNEIERLSRQLQEAYNTNNNIDNSEQIKKQMTDNTVTLAKYLNEINQKNVQIESLSQEIQRMVEIAESQKQEHLMNIQKINHDHQNEISKLSNEAFLTNQNLAKLEAQINFSQQSQEQQNGEKTVFISQLQEAKLTLQNIIAQHEQTIQKQSGTLDEQNKFLQQQQSENEQLKKQIGAYEQRLQDILNNQDLNQQQILQKQSQVEQIAASIQAQLEQQIGQNKELQFKNQSLQSEILKSKEFAETINQKMKKLNTTYETIVSKLQQECTDKTIDNKKSLKTIQAQVSQLQTLQNKEKRLMADIALLKQIQKPPLQYNQQQTQQEMQQEDLEIQSKKIEAQKQFLQALQDQVKASDMELDLKQQQVLLNDSQLTSLNNQIDDTIIFNSSEKKAMEGLPQLNSLLPKNTQDMLQNLVFQSFMLYNNIMVLIQMQAFLFPHIQSYEEQAIAILSISSTTEESHAQLKKILNEIYDGFMQMVIYVDFFDSITDINRVAELTPIDNYSRSLQKVISMIMKIHLDCKLPILQPLVNQKTLITHQIQPVQHFNSAESIFKIIFKQITQLFKNMSRQTQDGKFAEQDIKQLIIDQDPIIFDKTICRFKVLAQQETTSTSSEQLLVDQKELLTSEFIGHQTRQNIVSNIKNSLREQFQVEEQKQQQEVLIQNDAENEIILINEDNQMHSVQQDDLYAQQEQVEDMNEQQQVVVSQIGSGNDKNPNKVDKTFQADHAFDRILPEEVRLNKTVKQNRRLLGKDDNVVQSDEKFSISINSSNIAKDDKTFQDSAYTQLDTSQNLIQLQSIQKTDSDIYQQVVFRYKKQLNQNVQTKQVIQNIDKVSDTLFDQKQSYYQDKYDEIKSEAIRIREELIKLVKSASIIQIYNIILNNKYLKRVASEIENYDQIQILKNIFSKLDLVYHSTADIYNQINILSTYYKQDTYLYSRSSQQIFDYQSMIDNMICQLIQSDIISQEVSKVIPYKQSFEYSVNFQYNSSYLGYATLDYTKYSKIGFSDNIINYKFISNLKTISLLQNFLLIQQGKIIREQFVNDTNSQKNTQDLPIFVKDYWTQLTPQKMDQWTILDNQDNTDVIQLNYDKNKWFIQKASDSMKEDDTGMTSKPKFTQIISSYPEIDNISRSVLPLSLILSQGQKNIVQSPLRKHVILIKQVSKVQTINNLQNYKISEILSGKTSYVQILIGLQGDVYKLSCQPTNGGKYKRILLQITLDDWLNVYSKSPIRLKYLIQCYAGHNLNRVHCDLDFFFRNFLRGSDSGNIAKNYQTLFRQSEHKLDIKTKLFFGFGSDSWDFVSFFKQQNYYDILRKFYQVQDKVDEYKTGTSFISYFINYYFYLFNKETLNEDFAMNQFSDGSQPQNPELYTQSFITEFVQLSIDIYKYVAGFSTFMNIFTRRNADLVQIENIEKPMIFNFGNFFQHYMVNNIAYKYTTVSSGDTLPTLNQSEFPDLNLEMFVCKGSTQFWDSYLMKNDFYGHSFINRYQQNSFRNTAISYTSSLSSSFYVDSITQYNPYTASLISTFLDGTIFGVNSEVSALLVRHNPVIHLKTYIIILWFSQQCFHALQLLHNFYVQAGTAKSEQQKVTNQVYQLVSIYQNNVNQILQRIFSQVFKDSQNIFQSDQSDSTKDDITIFSEQFMNTDILFYKQSLTDKFRDFQKILNQQSQKPEQKTKEKKISIGAILKKSGADKKIKNSFLSGFISKTKVNQSGFNESYSIQIELLYDRAKQLSKDICINGDLDQQLKNFPSIQSLINHYQTTQLPQVSMGLKLPTFKYFYDSKFQESIVKGEGIGNKVSTSLDQLLVNSESYMSKQVFIAMNDIVQVKDNYQQDLGIKQVIDYSWYKSFVRQSLNMNVDKFDNFIKTVSVYD